MRKSQKWLRSCAAALTLLAALRAAPVIAQEAKPAVFLRASVASSDAVSKFIADLGIPIPINIKARIEQSFTFIGPGGVASDRPLGITFIAGNLLPKDQRVMFVIPVTPAAATADLLKNQGATADPANADVFTLGGAVHLKRLADYLVICPAPVSAINLVDNSIFAKDYPRPTTVAVANLNLAAARTAAPREYAAFFDKMTMVPPAGQAAMPAPGTTAHTQQAIAQATRAFADKLDRIAFAISEENNALLLRTWFIPLEIKSQHTFPRPAFPADVLAETHIVYPDAESASWIERFYGGIPENVIRGDLKGAPPTPEQTKALHNVLTIAARIIFTADAQSVAIQSRNASLVIYLVNQYAQDNDFSAAVQDFVIKANALPASASGGDTFELALGGPNGVSHLVYKNKGAVQGAFDFIQNGHTVTMAFSAAGDIPVDEVAKLPPNGEISKLCTGFLSLEQIMKSIDAMPVNPLAMRMPKPQLDALRLALAGQKIVWNVQSNEQQKFVIFDLELPLPVLKEAAMLVGGMMMGVPSPATPGGPPQRTRSPAPAH